MIFVTVTVQGEPDTKPFTRVFEYPKKSDEQIFFESVTMIKERVSKGLRININEVLTLFVNLIISEFVAGKTIGEIKKHASEFLSPAKVLIGVPESLRKLDFTVMLDGHTKESFTLDTPIPINKYVLSDEIFTHHTKQVR